MENYENENVEQELDQPAAENEVTETEAPGVQEPEEKAPETALEEPSTEIVQEEPAAETAQEEQVASEPYHNAGVHRKESPFADSPYVMQHPKTEYTPGYTMPNPGEHKPEKKQGGKIWKRILAAVLAVLLVAGSCAVTGTVINDYWENRTAQLTADMNDQIADLNDKLARMEDQIDDLENTGNSVSGSPAAVGDGLTPGQVFAQNEASVVLVYTMLQSGLQTGYSTGSGFILSEEGYVVTNYHVIEGGVAYSVVTSDGVEHEATLVGGESTNDIAVLKIEAEGLQAATLGSSDALIVGDQVVAIGNPLGTLTSTLTVGYVSAKERYVSTDNSSSINMLQTDCAINSGNSGGPLFNMYGQVVGITSAKYSGTTTSGASIEGIGFAIPIDDVVGMIADIIEYGYVKSAYLGIVVTTESEPNGAYVRSVESGYCAANAGMQAGDVIVAVGDKQISTMYDLTRALRNLNPGDTTTFTVNRNGKKVVLTITLDEKPRAGTTETPAEEMPLPEEGDFDEWYEYFRWFFDNQDD